jgi:hypothetical protein
MKKELLLITLLSLTNTQIKTMHAPPPSPENSSSEDDITNIIELIQLPNQKILQNILQETGYGKFDIHTEFSFNYACQQVSLFTLAEEIEKNITNCLPMLRENRKQMNFILLNKHVLYQALLQNYPKKLQKLKKLGILE